MAKTTAPDCPPLGAGLSTGYEHCAGTDKLNSSPMAGLCGVESGTLPGSCFSSPENHQEHQITRFVAKSKPTATKFEALDHKAAGDLPLRDDHPI
jgi:hypothetical protein